MEAIISIIGAAIQFVLGIAMLGGMVAFVYWIAKNPDQIIGAGNTWTGAGGCLGVIFLVIVAGFALAAALPILLGIIAGLVIAFVVRLFIRWFFGAM